MAKKTEKKKSKNAYLALRSTESTYQYYIFKNNAKMKDKLSFRKYDPLLRKHVLFKETKIKKGIKGN